jgi:hypothetical protein
MYNYLNPSTVYVKYFVGFLTPDCDAKANVIVKSNWVQSVVTGIAENNLLDFSIYPNPAKNRMEIAINENEFEIQITNVFGQVLLEERNNKYIDISNLSAGTYITTVKSGKAISQKKMVVY